MIMKKLMIHVMKASIIADLPPRKFAQGGAEQKFVFLQACYKQFTKAVYKQANAWLTLFFGSLFFLKVSVVISYPTV